jgi:hypothetical protein
VNWLLWLIGGLTRIVVTLDVSLSQFGFLAAKHYSALLDQSIKEYLRRIGAKGGKAVAGTPQAKA